MIDGDYSSDSSGDRTPAADRVDGHGDLGRQTHLPAVDGTGERSASGTDSSDHHVAAPSAALPAAAASDLHTDGEQSTTTFPAVPADPGFDVNEVFGASGPRESGAHGSHSTTGLHDEPAPPVDGLASGEATRAERRRAEAGAGQPPRDVTRTIARGVGQTLITLGVVVLLFVAYELWITDIFSAHKQASATQALNAEWSQQSAPDATTLVKPSTTADNSDSGVITKTTVVQASGQNTLVADSNRTKNYSTTNGEGFAKIYIPALGPDYVYTVIEGTDGSDLDVGPGHYAETQYPGQPGNFAMAGHRVSKGSPFNELGQLNSCDAIVIETNDSWYVYRILPMQNEVSTWSTTKRANCAGVSAQKGAYAKTFGREITDPSDYAQVMPVPHVDSPTVPAKAEKLVTLTTCHPQFSDAQRMIIHGILVKSYAKAGGFHPTELDES